MESVQHIFTTVLHRSRPARIALGSKGKSEQLEGRRTDLMVRIEEAGVAQFDDLLDAAGRRAVQVALVLAVLDEQAVVDVALHLLAADEVVVDAVQFARFGRPRRICPPSPVAHLNH